MKKSVALGVLFAAVLGGQAVSAQEAPVEPPTPVRILVFTETTAFRHDSIPVGVAWFGQLDATDPVEGVDFQVEAANDSAGVFTDANLARFDIVAWLSTTGNPVNTTEQAAFENFIRNGGGYVGIHAAADNEYNWPFYGDLAGAQFKSHPAIAQANVVVEDATNIATSHLPATWPRTDEWYNYRRNPRSYVCNTDPEAGPVETQTLLEPAPSLPFPLSLVEDPELTTPQQVDQRAKNCGVHVLLTLDETSYANNGDAMGDHPIAWCHDYEGGQAFYTGGGHTSESYAEPEFTTHLTGGLLIAADLSPCE